MESPLLVLKSYYLPLYQKSSLFTLGKAKGPLGPLLNSFLYKILSFALFREPAKLCLGKQKLVIYLDFKYSTTGWNYCEL
jgi:hypothetical protein